MLSRRDVLFGAVAGAAVLVRRATALRADASQPATAVTFDVPAGACDCHTHIFGDPRRFAVHGGSRLHAGAGVDRGDARAASRPAHGPRGRRAAQRVRHRQRLHARRRPSARRARPGDRRDRRDGHRAALDRDAPRRRPRAFASTSGRRARTIPPSPAGAFSRRPSELKNRPWHIQMYTRPRGHRRDQRDADGVGRSRSCSIISAARRRRAARSSPGSTRCWASCDRARPT